MPGLRYNASGNMSRDILDFMICLHTVTYYFTTYFLLTWISLEYLEYLFFSQKKERPFFFILKGLISNELNWY